MLDTVFSFDQHIEAWTEMADSFAAEIYKYISIITAWWRHQMEAFSALLAPYAGNSPVTGEFTAKRPVVWSFDVFVDLRLNERLSKHSWGWWLGTPSRPLWRHNNGTINLFCTHFCSKYKIKISSVWGFAINYTSCNCYWIVPRDEPAL